MAKSKTTDKILIDEIIKAIDENLIKRRKKYASLAYANEILIENRIFTKKDQQNKILKKILESGQISHAYQTDNSPKQWRIPLSEEGEKKYYKKKNVKKIVKQPQRISIIKNCPYCETELTKNNLGNLFCPVCNMDIEPELLKPFINKSKPQKKPAKKKGRNSKTNPKQEKEFKILMIVVGIIVVFAVIYFIPIDNTNSSSKNSTNEFKSQSSLVKQLNSLYVGRKYDMDIADELYEKYGYPETLDGTNNNVWIVYYPEGNFTMTQRKGDYIITSFENGRRPR